MADIGHRPMNGLYRLRFWKPGQFVADVHTITVPGSWQSQSFDIYMSFLDKGNESLVDVLSELPVERGRVPVVSIPVLPQS